MQETLFPFELVIGEDCSSDGTRKIVRRYAEAYPDIIHPLYNERNQGMHRNFQTVLAACRGEYIALLEGDDYWADPLKIQKQADFLESCPEYPICFHPVFILDERTGERRLTYCGAPGIKEYYTLDDLLRSSNFIPTASTLFRNFFVQKYPDWYGKCPYADFPLHILNLYLSECEKVGFINEAMAVYRTHSGGVYSGASKRENLERSLRTYQLLGANLYLSDRDSYRLGMSRWYADLCGVYKAEKMRSKAVLTAYRAFRIAPQRYKKRIARKALIALFPGCIRLLDWWTFCRTKVLKLSKALTNQQAPQI